MRLRRPQAVFLDRNGTINHDYGYVGKPEEFHLLEGVGEAVRIFNRIGAKVIVISNQSGIARGYFTKEDVERVNEKMREELAKWGARIDAVYFCPHHPSEGCECRKPKSALFKKAAEEFCLDLRECVLIGDKISDIEAAKRIGAFSILVLTGHGEEELKREGAKPDLVVPSLLDAAKSFLQ
jgi:D,D-heptose 1,7-bisphosphate phosphatase